MSLLEVKGLKKIYKTRFGGHAVEALKSVNFSVEEGEYVAIMGESGPGKTTLLNIARRIVHVKFCLYNSRWSLYARLLEQQIPQYLPILTVFCGDMLQNSHETRLPFARLHTSWCTTRI